MYMDQIQFYTISLSQNSRHYSNFCCFMFCEVLESLGPNRGQRLSVVSEALITSIMVVIKEYSITMYGIL